MSYRAGDWNGVMTFFQDPVGPTNLYDDLLITRRGHKDIIISMDN